MDQMTFSLFFQSLINGLNQGAIYALIALGYTMVYGIIRMINFAHGDFIMIGAYTLFYTIPLMSTPGCPHGFRLSLLLRYARWWAYWSKPLPTAPCARQGRCPH